MAKVIKWIELEKDCQVIVCLADKCLLKQLQQSLDQTADEAEKANIRNQIQRHINIFHRQYNFGLVGSSMKKSDMIREAILLAKEELKLISPEVIVAEDLDMEV